MKVRIALTLIILAALTRLMPHPVNFTALGAIGLFGASYFERRRYALLVPFAALFLSDLFLNNVIYSQYYTTFTWITSGWIYLAFAIVMLIGRLMLHGNSNPRRILAASLIASIAFFLVSNFSTWAETALYPKTMAGLLMCYTAGLPYFGNTILGDLVFSGALFGGYTWAVTHLLDVKTA